MQEHWKVGRSQRHQGVIPKPGAPALIKTDVTQRLRLYISDAGVSSCSRFKNVTYCSGGGGVTVHRLFTVGLNHRVSGCRLVTTVGPFFSSLSFFLSYSLQCTQRQREKGDETSQQIAAKIVPAAAARPYKDTFSFVKKKTKKNKT